jgi:hypothetical protein
MMLVFVNCNTVIIIKILNRKIASMKPTNVVSMDFTSAEAMEEFIKMYERDAPSLYSEAELLVLVKTEEASLIAIAAYPTEEDRLTASKTAQERIGGHFAPLFKESFRLLGDMVVHHRPNAKF